MQIGQPKLKHFLTLIGEIGGGDPNLTTHRPIRAFGTKAAAPAPRWPMIAVAALLCSGVAVAAIPRAHGGTADGDRQWRALGIGTLAGGGRTGLRADITSWVEPIDFAPERAQLHRDMVLGAQDSPRALLMRAGVGFADAVRAGQLIEDAADPAAGTRVAIELGAANGASRALERAQLKSGLGGTVTLFRDASGQLQVHRSQQRIDHTPLRIRGQVGDGLYWSLRSAGASPAAAQQYLQALATEIDVGGDVMPDDRFDLVLASRRAGTGESQEGALLYAGIDRAHASDLQLLRWTSGGRTNWLNAAEIGKPQTQSSGMAWPVAGRITSSFGLRRHPILGFARMHRGIDFGAGWGTPIVAAADGQVVAAGWAGGYGRQVRIAHGGGLTTSYSHMSSIVAEHGGTVRRGQLIGYVGSSGLSTGPHLHYEVYRGGVAINPLGVRFTTSSFVDAGEAAAIKARLKQLLSVGTRRS